MKYLSILSITLLLFSCGQSQLENSDMDTKIFSDEGILNKVNQGDSWDDVKKLAGDYWEVRDEPSSNNFQFRKDLHIGTEQILIEFLLSDNLVAGISLSIYSENITKAALLVYSSDLVVLYNNKFGVDISNDNIDNNGFNGKSYAYSLNEDVDSDSPKIGVICFESSPQH